MASSVDNFGEDSREERDLILKLLAEYTTKLKTLVEEQNRLQRIKISLLVATIALPFALFIALAYLSDGHYDLGTGLVESGAVPLLVAPVIFLLFSLAVFSLFSLFAAASRNAASVRYEVQLLHRQIGELVGRASQLEEHAELSSAYRLEFRLRLIEAQGVLDLAERTVLRYKSYFGASSYWALLVREALTTRGSLPRAAIIFLIVATTVALNFVFVLAVTLP